MKSKASTPVRIDADLYASAATAAEVMSRSTTQQIAHWARIGRELEASAEVSVAKVAEVLRGEASYDHLEGREQAIVRAFWAERMASLASDLDLRREFSQQGRPYVELNEDGEVVRREPSTRGAGSEK